MLLKPLLVLQSGHMSLSPTLEQAETCARPGLCRQVVRGVSLIWHLTDMSVPPWGLWPGSPVLSTGGQHFQECITGCV